MSTNSVVAARAAEHKDCACRGRGGLLASAEMFGPRAEPALAPVGKTRLDQERSASVDHQKGEDARENLAASAARGQQTVCATRSGHDFSRGAAIKTGSR